MSSPNVAAAALDPAACTPDPAVAAQRKSEASRAPAPLVALIAPTSERVAALRAALGDRYRYAEYSTGEQAWAALQFGSRFAAIVCAQALPGMEGAELVTRIRQSRDTGVRHLPACLVADTIDDAIRLRARKATVQYLAAFDRALSDIGPWLAEKLAPADSRASASRRTAALRQWAMGHRRLDADTRARLAIVRLSTEGLGDVAEVPRAAGFAEEAILAESYNTVWLCLDQPLSKLPRVLLALAVGFAEAGRGAEAGAGAGSVTIAYAPMSLLDHDTYERLQALAAAQPPAAGQLQLVTHHWQARLPFDLARLLAS